MSNQTTIAWCDVSSNPIKYRDRETGKTVWACVKKSAGCTNCYAEALALRWNKGRAFSRPNIDKIEPYLDEKELRHLGTDPKLSGKRVFVGDMTDIFGSWVPDDFLDRLFAVLAWRQDVTFQLLTKRPERMAAWFREAFQFRRTDGDIGWHGREERVFEAMQDLPWIDDRNDAHWTPEGNYRWPGWPLPNVWLGTSVEDQRAADVRISHLLAAPAAVHWLSCEPLLGPVDLRSIRPNECQRHDVLRGAVYGWADSSVQYGHGKVDWVVTGGESGAGYRPMDLTWLADLVRQCRESGVPVFVKQDSHRMPGRQGRIPDELFVQEFPTVAAPT